MEGALMNLSRGLIAVACTVFAGAMPAHAWWQYAEWGLSQSQIVSASSGQAVPCRPDAPACARTPSGGQPSIFVPSTQMLGMPASVAFTFNGAGGLSETTVLFTDADFAMISGLLLGIQGQPVEDRQAAGKVWRDQRRGSTITAMPAGRGTRVTYRPTKSAG